ncbi:helix-turn-helix transcriptional regulator [Dehalogenimonas etheniformans]|nr:helix-turn-helix transcriptional regulator [Dehalogenimonas etheniformans]QNT76788.1 helix-turn-helix transcriptional regulator [Dehalogenimonas etheniformans]
MTENYSDFEPISLPAVTQSGQIEAALRERVKELNCLYGISRLAERAHSSLNQFLREIAEFLPHAWQYPDVAKAKIVYNDQVFTSSGFNVSEWHQVSQIKIGKSVVGECAIYYTELRPLAFEGPFLEEERVLLDAVAERIGNLASHIAADEELKKVNSQLQSERKALQEANIALKVILSRKEDDRNEIIGDINTNVDKVIKPLLFSLESQLTPDQKTCTHLISSLLDDIVSPFVSNLTHTYSSLSLTELEISNLIKVGLSTKEIAKLRNVAPGTINRHRENIRRKLRVTNSHVNLTAFLQTLPNK